jgi:hypothetical protein
MEKDTFLAVKALNECFGTVVTHENMLTFANVVAARRPKEDEQMTRVNSHTPYLVYAQYSPNRVFWAVLCAMIDSEM